MLKAKGRNSATFKNQKLFKIKSPLLGKAMAMVTDIFSLKRII